MNVVSFKRQFFLTIDHGPGDTLSFCPGVKYVVSEMLGQHIRALEPKDSEFHHPYPSMPDLKADDIAGEQILMMCQPLGIGDQLISTAFVSYFRHELGCRVHQACYSFHSALWANCPALEYPTIQPPIPLECLEWRTSHCRAFFDEAFFFPDNFHVCRSKGINVYDLRYSSMGIAPEEVPLGYKRPVYETKPEDEILWSGDWTTKGVAVVQPSSSPIFGPERSWPLRIIQFVARALSESGIMSIWVHDAPFPTEISREISRARNALNFSEKIPDVRKYARLIERSSLVIGCDSSALHFAAAFNKSAIGIWGLSHPDTVATYYPNQVHIYHDDPTRLNAGDACERQQYQQIADQAFGLVEYDEIVSALKDALK